MLDKKYLIFVIAFVVFVLFNMFFQGWGVRYDASRNEKVITELVTYGTFTYFDVPFIVSPPLYFIIHSVPVALFGTDQAVFKFTEAAMYLLGLVIIFFFMGELNLPKKLRYFVFLFPLIDVVMFNQIQALDFWGAILLFTSLIMLFYIRIYKKPSLFNIIGFGVAVGASMLVKSSFIFLIIPLILHYFIFSLLKKDLKAIIPIVIALIIGLAVYSPWIYYLTSNGFPIITNPEAQGQVIWDPNFQAYSFADIYSDVWLKRFFILYPFSIIIGLYFILATFRSIQFEEGFKLRRRLAYFYYKNRGLLGSSFIALLMIIILLPFFNALMIVIPVGEQYISIGIAIYMLLGIILFKSRDRKLQYLIALVLVVNVLYAATSFFPFTKDQQHYSTCELYTEFFSSLGSDSTILVDERLSPLAYPTHNIMYKPFFEWFSYQENYDVSRIITLNVDYIVLIDSDRIPSYLSSTFFEQVESHSCQDLRTGNTYNSVVFRVVDRDAFASSVGLPEKGEFTIKGDGSPIQASVLVSTEGFDLQYKSKRDGSLILYFPAEGEYNIQVVRPGFKSSVQTVQIPLDGDININLGKDSPFITHTTSNRY